MLISERIFDLLKIRGMSQKEFSQLTGIPQSTISDWKGKRLNPSADKILIISNVLGISAQELLSSADAFGSTARDYVVVATDSEEFHLIEVFRSLPAEQRSRLLGYMEALEDK